MRYILGFDPIHELCVLRITPHTSVYRDVYVSQGSACQYFPIHVLKGGFFYSPFSQCLWAAEDQGGAGLTA